jgi:hypothetical protein
MGYGRVPHLRGARTTFAKEGIFLERRNELAACLIHNGTVTGHRDMIRALETVEGLTYRQILDGETMAEGRATLVKLMAEPGAATILVNGCLFLNVLSFRHLTFETDDDGKCVFELVGDGMKLELVPTEDEDETVTAPNPRAVRLMAAESFDPETYAILEDDDEDDGR